MEKNRVVVSFNTDVGLVDAVYEARALDPAALSWVLFFTSADIDEDRAVVTVAITKARYEFLLDAMEGVAEYVPMVIESEMQAEACELSEAD